MVYPIQGETHSYIYTVDNPSEGLAYIYYCWPLSDGSMSNQRKFMKFTLRMPRYSPGERPFWVKLLTTPIDKNIHVQNNPNIYGFGNYNRFNENLIFNYYYNNTDTLIFYLDRNVIIDGNPIPWYFDGTVTSQSNTRVSNSFRYKPDIIIKRIQHLQSVKQFNHQNPGRGIDQSNTEKRILSSRESREIIRPNRLTNTQVVFGTSELLIQKESTISGGIKITLTEYWEEGLRQPRTYLSWQGLRTARQSKTLAKIELKPIDNRQKVAWYIKVDNNRTNNRFNINIVFSENIEVELHTNNDSPIHLPPIVIPYIRLRFRQLNHNSIKRPNEDWRLHFTNSLREQARNYNFVLHSLHNPSNHFLIDLTLGFIPIIGDLVDIGEFIYALITKQNRWGEEVSDTELMLMALGAILPMMSSSLARNTAHYIDNDISASVNREIRDYWSNPEDFLEFMRPGLIPYLEKKVIDILGGSSQSDKLRLILQKSNDEDIMYLLSEFISLQGPRNAMLMNKIGI